MEAYTRTHVGEDVIAIWDLPFQTSQILMKLFVVSIRKMSSNAGQICTWSA